jgi:ADP-ribose pyrophosphatase
MSCDIYNFSPKLQFVAIKRGDSGEWALPGGMVDPGEVVSATAIREFQEEAMNSLSMSEGITCNFICI